MTYDFARLTTLSLIPLSEAQGQQLAQVKCLLVLKQSEHGFIGICLENE